MSKEKSFNGFRAMPSDVALSRLRRHQRLSSRRRREVYKLGRVFGYLCLAFCAFYTFLFFRFFHLTSDVALSIFRTHEMLLSALSLIGIVLGMTTVGLSIARYFLSRRRLTGISGNMLTFPLIAGLSCCLTGGMLLTAILLFNVGEKLIP